MDNYLAAVFLPSISSFSAIFLMTSTIESLLRQKLTEGLLLPELIVTGGSLVVKLVF